MEPVKKKKILVADDEPDILEIISYTLSGRGYEVMTAADGSEALDKARAGLPDLVILDVMMPKKNGMEVCEILRSQPAFDDTLIIFLTALTDDTSHIRGLESGADDYLSKPISPRILLSKVQALFRRTKKERADGLILVGDMEIDPVKFRVSVGGRRVVLAKKEFELLLMLASKPGRVFLRHEILNQVWGNDVIVGDRTIDVHIRKIRQKLQTDCITTVKGVGYKVDM